MSIRLITIRHPHYRSGEAFQVEENVKYGIVLQEASGDVYVHDVVTNAKFAICKNRVSRFWDKHIGKEVGIYCTREMLNGYPIAINNDPQVEIFRDEYFDNLEYYKREAEYFKQYSACLEQDVREVRSENENIRRENESLKYRY